MSGGGGWTASPPSRSARRDQGDDRESQRPLRAGSHPGASAGGDSTQDLDLSIFRFMSDQKPKKMPAARRGFHRRVGQGCCYCSPRPCARAEREHHARQAHRILSQVALISATQAGRGDHHHPGSGAKRRHRDTAFGVKRVRQTEVASLKEDLAVRSRNELSFARPRLTA